MTYYFAAKFIQLKSNNVTSDCEQLIVACAKCKCFNRNYLSRLKRNLWNTTVVASIKISVRRRRLTLSIGPNSVCSTCRRRPKPLVVDNWTMIIFIFEGCSLLRLLLQSFGVRQSQLYFSNVFYYYYYIPTTCFGPYGPSSGGIYIYIYIYMVNS
jgi:hypothetical protein